ncbi:MAG: ATP-binding protein, partial [Chitinophagales bacterium]
KEADIRLLQANERFEKVTQATNDAIWDWNIKDDTLYWGGGFTKLFGYEVSKITPSLESWTEHIYPDDRDRVVQSIHEAIEDSEQTNWVAEYSYRKSDGTFAKVIDRGIVIRNVDGKPMRMVGAMTDITEQKNHEKQLLELNESLQNYAKDLERSNEELESFAFITSHDLQEPLRMISSFMDQLKRKYGDQLDEKALQYIHYASDGAKRMKRIILDLLEYSRAAKPIDSLEEVDLNEILSEFKQLRRKVISEKAASISSVELPTVTTYKAGIAQVFNSLLDNAIKYAEEGKAPQIEINAIEKEAEWEFSIKDNGIGIDSEFFEKIFLIFQRLHNRDQYAGTGIGLSIAKRHVEFLGGKIWLKSELGKGATFYFSIPKTQ